MDGAGNSAGEPIPISALQHAVYCLRQAALIHLERLWAENRFTAEGDVLHAIADKGGSRRARGVRRVMSLPLASARLNLTGTADLVEFIPGPDGETAFPVEYKRGKPKPHDADELQLCAQAMCLEEMLCCQISDGALFYGEPRRRTPVEFTAELRQRVRDSLAEMHDYLRRGCTPKVKPQKGCSACSLKELCLPKLMKAKSVSGAHGRVRKTRGSVD